MRRATLLACCLAMAQLLVAGEEEKPLSQRIQAPLERGAIHAPLQQATRDLEKLAKVKIQVQWLPLIEAGVKPDTIIALPATTARFDQLLDQLLLAATQKGKPLAWYTRDNTVIISTQERVIHREASLPSEQKESASSKPAAGIDFRQTPLSDVLAYLAVVGNVNIHPSYAALKESGIEAGTLVTLSLPSVSVAQALDILTDDLSAGKDRFQSIYWIIQDGVVTVTTGEALNQKLQTRTYEVADLLVTVPDFQGPTVNLQYSTNTGGASGASSSSGGIFDTATRDQQTGSAEGKAAMGEKLMAAIKDSIGEDMWQPQGKGAIRLLGDKLVISQTPLGFELLEGAAGKKTK